MNKLFQNRYFYLLILIIVALFSSFIVNDFTADKYPTIVRLGAILLILSVGSIFVLNGIAKIIEETTAILSFKTKVAGGLLQSLGTAFPDMVLGVAAALISLKLRNTDMVKAINFAVIAAATTFGSNIYNVGHAAWCIYRQVLSNKKIKEVKMFPIFPNMGTLKPMSTHTIRPSFREIDVSLRVSVALTLLTSLVAISMVVFGRTASSFDNINGDLYQLIRPAGFILFFLCVLVLYAFRKTHRLETSIDRNNFYHAKGNIVIWVSLVISGIVILLTANSMVKAIEVFCEITKTPYVIAGALSGLIGCLGEMIVIHNFSINPKGRIGDAIVGVAMDNIVTIMGASIVAIMGGIFLGGNALILIFVIILTLNTVLIWQISNLKNFFLVKN